MWTSGGGGFLTVLGAMYTRIYIICVCNVCVSMCICAYAYVYVCNTHVYIWQLLISRLGEESLSPSRGVSEKVWVIDRIGLGLGVRP